MFSARRRGAAAVELGVCLPLFVLVIVGSIETCSLIYLQESLSVASYEAARMAAKPGAENSELVENAKKILSCRGIQNATVKTEPRNLQNVKAGDFVSVAVSVPAGTQSMLPNRCFGKREISSQVTFVKE